METPAITRTDRHGREMERRALDRHTIRTPQGDEPQGLGAGSAGSPTGRARPAVKAFEKTTTKAAAFGSAIGGLAVKGVTALWDTVKGFAGDVVNMSDSTDKFMNTMSFAGIDTKAVQAAAKETRKYADDTVYLSLIHI